MEFKDRIKTLRAERGITPSHIAVFLGKSESAVRAWELERSKPDADTLIKLAGYFNCSTDYLLGISDYRNPNEKDEVAALCSDLEKYVLNIRSGKELFEGLVRFLEVIPERDHQHITPAYLKIAQYFADALGGIYKFQEECEQTRTFDLTRFFESYCIMSDTVVEAKSNLNFISIFPLEQMMAQASEYGSVADYNFVRRFYTAYHNSHRNEGAENI